MRPALAMQEILKALESVLAEGELTPQQQTFVQNLQQNAKWLKEIYVSLPEDVVALRRVVLNVAHEFRTPISPLIGYSSLLLLRPEDFGGELSATQRENLRIVRDKTQWISDWYQAIVEEAQTEVKTQYKAVPQACHLPEILALSEAVLRYYLHEKPIQLTVLIPEKLPPIHAAAYHLAHLIEHIVKIMAFELIEYGKIQISAVQNTTFVELIIFCTGISLNQAEIESLFVKNGRHLYRQRFEQQGGRIEFSREAGIGGAVHLLITIAKN